MILILEGESSYLNRRPEAQELVKVRRTLQRWKYPPDKADGAIELVMKQAEILSNEWSK